MGTEYVGVTVAVNEPVDGVFVTSRDGVFVLCGTVGVEAVADGVNIDCSVNAAAVWTSLGGSNCSKGILQANIARMRTIPARVRNLEFMEMLMGGSK